jgi:cell division initiation protein
LGYRRSAVDQLLNEVAASFEDVWRERADLADRLESVEADLARYREQEALLRRTLVSAERASQELRERAQREADVILSEAHAKARDVTRSASGDRERLLAEGRRVRALLQAALETLDETGPAEEPPHEEHQPKIDDTRAREWGMGAA